jgi:hypothetical protein
MVVIGLASMTLRAANYFVDAAGGNDVNGGTSSNAAWQSLAKVNATTFSPGDAILFKSGGSWTGQLNPKGSGATNNPIVINSYGAGAKPKIDGNGVATFGAVYLFNQRFWEINNLEVVNDGAADATRCGIFLCASNYGTVHHLYVRNCDVHNIRGTVGSDSCTSCKRTGGIMVYTIEDGAVATRFNDVRIEGCTITSVRSTGIMGCDNGTSRSDYPGTTAWNARKITNFIIRSNVVSDVAKNGIIMRLCDESCLVERNICFDTAMLTTGNTMFTAGCRGTVFQYNEGYRNRAGAPTGDHDGSMYDADLRSPGIIFQYSYSHDNAHGLYWNYSSDAEDGIIVRYNISQNDQGDVTSLFQAS